MTEIDNIADKAAEAVLREYRTNKKGTALAYVRLARKLHASGVSQGRALAIIDKAFPTEAKAFVAAQNRGEKLPILFPRAGESYETRRAKAMARGGIIG